MADRLQFNDGDRLPASQLDQIQANLQAADDAQAVDASAIGIVQGLTVTAPGTGTLVNVSAGAAYNKSTGRRMVRLATAAFNVNEDEFGAPTDVTVVGEKKILSLFVRPMDALQTAIPGSPTIVLESHELFVRQGAQAVSPVPPALLSDAILLVDITRLDAAAQPHILSSALDFTRRESSVKLTQAVLGMLVESPSLRGALQVLMDRFAQDGNSPAPNDTPGAEFVNTSTGKSSTNWTLADGNVNDTFKFIVQDIGNGDGASRVASTARASTNLTLSAGNVSTQLASLVSQVGNVGGDLRVGAGVKTSGGLSVIAGTVESQVQDILDYLAVTYDVNTSGDILVALADALLVENFGPTANGGVTTTATDASAVVGVQLRVGQKISGIRVSASDTGLNGSVRLRKRVAPAGSPTTVVTASGFGGVEAIQPQNFTEEPVSADTNYWIEILTGAGAGVFTVEMVSIKT